MSGIPETPAVSRRVRAWYGLPGEIVIESDYWHLVKVGPLPLPHPPVVNFFIRRGLSPRDRLYLSYLHELGHLQTLPVALLYALWLWRGRRGGPRASSWWRRLARLALGVAAHEAAWELAAEAYVVAKTGRTYRRLYRERPNPLLALFWGGMAALVLAGTASLRRGSDDAADH